jgi:hypothetical protein
MLSSSPGQFNIVPTFASNITKDKNAAKIEAAINAAISALEADFSTPLITSIKFQEGGALGSGDYFPVQESYSAWRTALIAHATDANQGSAIASSVPKGPGNPVTGSQLIFLSPPNARALGFSVPSLDLQPGGFDDVITLNTSICNLTRTSVDPNKYDLQSVAEHEIDEALGISSNMDGSGLMNGDPPPADIMPSDLFRYAKKGKRSFNTDADSVAYFSIDGGKTELAQFNQDASGDFGDWFSVDGNQVPQVQDAFSTAGAIPPLNVELTRLDVIGYTPTFTVGTSIVSGTVFNDANGNSAQGKSESNLSGFTIEAIQSGTVITTATSNALGYQIGGLADGTYTIEVVPQAGFTQTAPATTYTITLTGHNQTITGKDFGETSGVNAATGIFTNALSIGNPALSGSASCSGDVYTVSGSGVDIFHQSDQFEYDFIHANGDATLSADVLSVSNTEPWAKAGVMIRGSNAADSVFADVVVTPDRGVAFQWRATQGAPAQSFVQGGVHVPRFVKLTRTGNVFTAYTSMNGQTWSELGTPQSVGMSYYALAGLAVTSITRNSVCDATFADVSLSHGGHTSITQEILN